MSNILIGPKLNQNLAPTHYVQYQLKRVKSINLRFILTALIIIKSDSNPLKNW
jgi:hypothetical protein